MTPRERVIRALKRREPDKVPTCSRFTPWMMRTFNERVGAGIPEQYLTDSAIPSGFIHEVRPSFLTPDEYFGWEVRHVSFAPPQRVADFSAYLPDLPPGSAISEWGVAYVPGSLHHYKKSIPPLKGMTSVDELRNYPFPNPMEPQRHRRLDDMVAQVHEDQLAAAGFLQQTLFELAWEMRGMEELFLDFSLNKPFASYLLDRLTEIRCQMAARYAEAGVDILRLGDDLGTQETLMMSPETWREMLMPRLRQVIEAARKQNPEIIIFFHTDGFVQPIIEDFIDIGIDVLNPIQPECMDLAFLKREYGDRLSFWGGVGIQKTMPFGTVAEVREAVRWTIDTLGAGGGLLIAPTHTLMPDVPWENVVAFFEAVDEFGWYAAPS
ncbi:MAG: hypothetical protein JRH07_18230 [Deltaproteobacteria bacterium]|nr:hypothetical protein [Deltaproteobacteria bacterium]